MSIPKFNVDQEACCPLCGELLDSKSTQVIVPHIYDLKYSDEQNWSKGNFRDEKSNPPHYFKFSKKQYSENIPHNPIHVECWDKAMNVLRDLMFPDKSNP